MDDIGCSMMRFCRIRRRSMKNLEQQQFGHTINMALKSKDVNMNEGEPVQDQHNRSDHNIKFYEEYRKIFATGFYLSLQLKQLAVNKDDLWKKLLVYEKRAQEEFKDKMRKQAPERKKRFRRTANEIQKIFHCDAEKCNRNYGSEGSLLQHIKLKHPEKYEELIRTGKAKLYSESNNPDSAYD